MVLLLVVMLCTIPIPDQRTGARTKKAVIMGKQANIYYPDD